MPVSIHSPNMTIPLKCKNVDQIVHHTYVCPLNSGEVNLICPFIFHITHILFCQHIIFYQIQMFTLSLVLLQYHPIVYFTKHRAFPSRRKLHTWCPKIEKFRRVTISQFSSRDWKTYLISQHDQPTKCGIYSTSKRFFYRAYSQG